MLRGCFLFYSSYFEAISELSDEEQGSIYKAIIDYGIANIEPENLTPTGKMCFKLIKPTIDASLKRYDASIQNGRKGGRPPKNLSGSEENLNKTQWKPSENLVETQKGLKQNLNKDKDNNKDNDKERDNDFATSLSQRFPNIGQDVCVENFFGDKDKLFQEIEKSDFLKSASLSFIVDNYSKVLSGKYATFKPQKDSGMATHKYSKEQLNNSFDDLDKVQID